MYSNEPEQADHIRLTEGVKDTVIVAHHGSAVHTPSHDACCHRYWIMLVHSHQGITAASI